LSANIIYKNTIFILLQFLTFAQNNQKDTKGTTTINDEYNIITNNINIELNNHIPNFGFTIFQKLYNKVLTTSEVQTNYKQYKTRFNLS
jgi:hypothetical protein